MKVGILSINIHTKVLNFASVLHSYAFQSFLDEHGIDSTIIEYKPCYYGPSDVRHPYDYWKAHPKKNEIQQQELLDKWERLYHEREERFDKFEAFIKKYYKKTDLCYTQELLDKKDPGCDIYMCVTDVIWKYNPKSGFDRGYFLACDMLRGKPKIAYAASKGPTIYTAEQAAIFRKLVQDFDYISCREQSLTSFINKNTCKKAITVLDPVFLKDADFYIDLSQEPKEKDYVLIYTVMENAGKLVDDAIRFAKERNLAVIDISDDKTILYQSPYGERTTKYGIGIEEWLGYMNHAAYIFTNSFHCCCMSVILKKQFFVGARSGDKIDSILQLLDLSDRRIISSSADAKKDIDYVAVDAKLKKLRCASEKWVLNAIKKSSTPKHTLLHVFRRKRLEKKK